VIGLSGLNGVFQAEDLEFHEFPEGVAFAVRAFEAMVHALFVISEEDPTGFAVQKPSALVCRVEVGGFDLPVRDDVQDEKSNDGVSEFFGEVKGQSRASKA